MKVFKKVFPVLLVGLAVPGQAHAYLDPNSGSILLQILLGGFAGVALAGKMFWGNLKSFFTFGRGKNAQAEQEEASEGNQ